MLVCTEGKERTLGEYRDLLEDAGFQNVEGRSTGRPLDAILAIKPWPVKLLSAKLQEELMVV
jgi:acetylserotonin N-methyltransferase